MSYVSKAEFNIYRDGQVHVMAEKCSTCIFRPGNLMDLAPGRVAGMVRDCLEQDSTIVCHKTLYRRTRKHAVCRGFFDAYQGDIAPLRLAVAMGKIKEQPITIPKEICFGRSFVLTTNDA